MMPEPENGLLRPQAVIFDWDNTVIDSWAAIHDAQNHVLAHYGMRPWTLAETKKRVRGSMRDSYPDLFGDRWLEAGDIFYARFEAHHLENLVTLTGAEALLEELHAAGVYLAVVSNKKGNYLRAEAERLGLAQYFGRIIGAFDAPRDKPAVEPVDMALSGSGIAPGQRAWFVGDADIDMECAHNAGCTPILVREEEPAPDEFGDNQPAAYVANCILLSKLFRKL